MEITPESAFFMQLEGIALDDLNELFFRQFMEDYNNTKDTQYNLQVDMILRTNGHYYYQFKNVNDKLLVCTLQRMAFTVGLMIDVKPSGDYNYRYCFPTLKDAYLSLKEWDGQGHPPGNWIKRKGEGGDLRNPRLEEEL